MCCCFFFFKQKTAYDMRISDWSSDVCSSDLRDHARDRRPARAKRRRICARPGGAGPRTEPCRTRHFFGNVVRALQLQKLAPPHEKAAEHRPTGELRPRRECRRDRKRGVWGKGVLVRVGLGGGRTGKKEKQ